MREGWSTNAAQPEEQLCNRPWPLAPAARPDRERTKVRPPDGAS